MEKRSKQIMRALTLREVQLGEYEIAKKLDENFYSGNYTIFNRM